MNVSGGPSARNMALCNLLPGDNRRLFLRAAGVIGYGEHFYHPPVYTCEFDCIHLENFTFVVFLAR